jgi:hypothetical protein
MKSKFPKIPQPVKSSPRKNSKNLKEEAALSHQTPIKMVFLKMIQFSLLFSELYSDSFSLSPSSVAIAFIKNTSKRNWKKPNKTKLLFLTNLMINQTLPSNKLNMFHFARESKLMTMLLFKCPEPLPSLIILMIFLISDLFKIELR